MSQSIQTQLPDSILLHECETSKEPIKDNLPHPRDADVQQMWCVIRDIRRHQYSMIDTMV